MQDTQPVEAVPYSASSTETVTNLPDNDVPEKPAQLAFDNQGDGTDMTHAQREALCRRYKVHPVGTESTPIVDLVTPYSQSTTLPTATTAEKVIDNVQDKKETEDRDDRIKTEPEQKEEDNDEEHDEEEDQEKEEEDLPQYHHQVKTETKLSGPGHTFVFHVAKIDIANFNN
ncbi:bromo and FHA domain-containing protein DDB_G0267958-like [Sycon ciliatum]|uniref:bromo and FHA domain-containing protein DDB_G0267958-like n=1 Tax=Sycon ciliatum TaxID=27933 RepID=UPI0031F694C1